MHNDFFTTADGVKLFTAHRLPAADPKAVVLVAHGYGEHSGRYTHVLEALADAGYAAYTLDHYGHGRSDGIRAYFASFDQPVSHLKAYADRVSAAHPGKKLFLLGHSMGALISLVFTLRYRRDLAGLLISGAPVNADANVSPLVIQVGYLLNRIAPRLPLLQMVGLDTLSSDPQVAQAFAADPLNYKANMRVGMGVGINETAKAVRTRLSEITLPILIMHGEQDQLVNPSGSQTVYERVSSADKTLHMYADMRHEIMNERDKTRVLNDISAWLNAHI